MASSRRLAVNVFAGVLSNVLRICMHIVMLPLIARLLGPEELGLAALALPTLSFVLLLSDAGLNNSLAREKEDDNPVWSSAFWGLMGTGLALAIILYGSSFLVAFGAHQPRLPSLMLPLSACLLFVAATVVPSARMLRAGRLAEGATIDLTATLAGGAISIYMAFHGFGVWSVVAQTLVIYSLRWAMFSIRFPFLPKFEFELTTLLKHTSVSGAMISQRLIELFGRVLENGSVSRTLGSAALGSYGYSNQIGRFFTDAVANPLWANLYYLAINRPRETMRESLLNAQRMLAIAVLPASALVVPLLPVLVPLLFGPKWHDSIYMMMILILTYPFTALGGQIFSIQLAWDKPRPLILSVLALNAARVIAVLLTYRLGLFGMACAISVVNVASYVLGLIITAHTLQSPITEQLQVIRGPLLSAAAAGLISHFLIGSSEALVWLGASSIVAGVAFVAAMFVFDGRRARADIDTIARMLSKKLA